MVVVVVVVVVAVAEAAAVAAVMKERRTLTYALVLDLGWGIQKLQANSYCPYK
jgi:hypothetical protein